MAAEKVASLLGLVYGLAAGLLTNTILRPLTTSVQTTKFSIATLKVASDFGLVYGFPS